MTRVTLYILLPISVVGALVFVALGMPQTLAGAVDATTLEGAKQTISIGPVASQEIIKELGTNGGGFFNANAAHPFENPNAWTNFAEIWALLLIPVASVLAFGRAVGNMRQGWAILAAMAVFFIVGVGVAYWSETAGNPILTAQGVDPSAGNLEGKEIRNGQAMSVLYVTATSGTSTGSVNTMHDSLTPLGGHGPDVQPSRRLHLAGRRGSGTVWVPRPRDHRSVRRRADGRPHARISRQEDRSARNEIRDVRGADLSADCPGLHWRFGAYCRPRWTA